MVLWALCWQPCFQRRLQCRSTASGTTSEYYRPVQRVAELDAAPTYDTPLIAFMTHAMIAAFFPRSRRRQHPLAGTS